jgi:hypothetical protein
MNVLFALIFVFAATGGDVQVRHAAETVANLHDLMLDPASFVIDSVFVTKPDKHGNVSYCYSFRSHNRMGGYSDGRAVEDGGDHGRLSVYNHDDGYGRFQGYDVGWVAPCKGKNLDKDLTDEAAGLAKTLYRKDK